MMRPLAPLLLSSFFLALAVSAADGASDEKKPVLYNAIHPEVPDLRRDAAKAFAATHRVLEPRVNEGFDPGGLKGCFTSTLRFRDPRSVRVYPRPGRIRWAFIV